MAGLEELVVESARQFGIAATSGRQPGDDARPQIVVLRWLPLLEQSLKIAQEAAGIGLEQSRVVESQSIDHQLRF